MIELPFLSLDLLRSMVQNFTIIATLVLLYNFIPDTLISRSKLAFSICVGFVFGLAAAISMPALWHTADAAVIGFNLILVPLAGVVGGPVSSLAVAVVLLAGCFSSAGGISLQDIVTVMCGILLGALFYAGTSLNRFPKSPFIQFLLLGTGVAVIEAYATVFSFAVVRPPGPVPVMPALISVLPFVVASCIITIILGYIIGFIDRRKAAEKELREYRAHLEDLVKERTAELRQANALQKATIESTADAILVVDRQGLIRAYNQKASRILGLPAHLPKEGEVAGEFPQILASRIEDPATVFSLIAALPESAEQVVTPDLRFTNRKIYELYVQAQMIGNRSAGRVWSLHDITAQRHAEEAIRAVNSKLVLLSGITRHDILNQITALSAYLDLVRERIADPPGSGHLETMGKILEVIRLQLEFTRDYQDLGVREPVWQNIGTVFSRAAESFAEKKIAFRYDTGTAEIYADPLIERVFYNLIDNSIRHGGHVTEIRLSAEKADPDLLLVYEDNGTGVVPEEKEKIFLKGFGKHTGLGMFLAKEILSITGITIRENGIHGQGVRFSIRVPSGRFRTP
ncbi:MAG: sensory histidine kinase AtoS [Methanoregula sp. PtaU1.Bin006]|nr:MAG: sensory histidine kinase AtoS [Methanoregula sp. PtaB.Bin085]OPY33929.1 MAG: sensory histidine kinase AtoS [Methanoregula sp. PtaU1.Bin006]